jgi:four helix bundle protein
LRTAFISRILKENMNKKSVYKKAEEFSFGILELVNATDRFNKDFHVSDQISRSSTSIAANLSEAKFSISDKMYLHKVSLSIREAEETSYWLRVLKIKGHINQDQYEILEKDCKQIVAELYALMRFVRNKKK